MGAPLESGCCWHAASKSFCHAKGAPNFAILFIVILESLLVLLSFVVRVMPPPPFPNPSSIIKLVWSFKQPSFLSFSGSGSGSCSSCLGYANRVVSSSRKWYVVIIPTTTLLIEQTFG